MKAVKRFPNYSVTQDGKVYSRSSNRYLAVYTDAKGYKIVSLCQNGKAKKCRVHRLVAEAYISNPMNKPFINHIDSNPANNSYMNLEWCSAQENTDHMMSKGRNSPPPLNKRRTHCFKGGHELTAENTIVQKDGIHRCRECFRVYHRQYWHKRKMEDES